MQNRLDRILAKSESERKKIALWISVMLTGAITFGWLITLPRTINSDVIAQRKLQVLTVDSESVIEVKEPSIGTIKRLKATLSASFTNFSQRDNTASVQNSLNQSSNSTEQSERPADTTSVIEVPDTTMEFIIQPELDFLN